MDTSRRYWIDTLDRIARPVLEALADGTLKKKMPIESTGANREHVTYLEALGRTLTGMAPWLELEASDPGERKLVEEYRELAVKAIDSGTNPASPDYMNFGFAYGRQPIVDAAFLAHALIRAPRQLLGKLPQRVKENVVRAFQGLRYGSKPSFTNWLLFSAMIETALYRLGADWDQMRVDYALRQVNAWYVGDGAYSDGAAYHWDYYNSFVIQPMYLDILREVADFYPEWQELRKTAVRRAARYAALMERMVAADGSYPVTGRSVCYRCGAFQILGQIALMEELPEELKPEQARCAMSAVIHRTIDAPGTFDAGGWLKIGLAGSQPSLGESYISTGSLYLCCAGFLPLGLPAENRFWSAPDAPWTSQKVWGGTDLAADHAIPV